ncbi:MAG: recombinase RecA [Bacteroidetes bacterium]|nr:recombinase RecA [Bacteroidota bacterium]
MSTNSENSEKLKALQLTIEKLEKSYGKGTVMKLSDEKVQDMPAISTGSIGLDMALGIGGLPRGRVIEIYGPESSGKTTLAMHAISEAQKAGGIAAFIDAEHAFDRLYAENLGIDTENLLISQPDNGEQALEITENLIRSGAIDILVVDSVAALVPRNEIEGEMGDSTMGLQARLMSQALRKLTGTINKTGCCCIFINQLRQKIGVFFGNPETTTGGNALKFYASVRLDIRKIGQIKEGPDKITGNRVKVKVAKNKVAPPFRTVEFDIMYGKGISKEGEVVDMSVELDIIQKSGSWFSFKGNKIGQGRDSVKAMLLDNPELMEELENKIREQSQPTLIRTEKMSEKPQHVETNEVEEKVDGEPDTVNQ